MDVLHPITQRTKTESLYTVALALSGFTIFYNLVEGAVATYFGYADETLALFGFGVDSFIETISGVGVAYMILRMKRNPHSSKDPFEITALHITGGAFYALAAGLVVTIVVNLYHRHVPETTQWGVFISLISIVVMLALIYAKVRVGKQLHSAPILADANCTKVCVYMSVILLVSSAVYELTKFAYVDVIGTAGLVYFSVREGKECFEKARGIHTCSCGHD